jgi:alpha-L-rhamnosidase
MKKLFLLLMPILMYSLLVNAQVIPGNLLTENLTNPIGLDVPNPRFSWQLITEMRNVSQSDYEIKITSGKTNIWNSGKIESDQSVQVPYAGPALQSGKKYSWQVRSWDNIGKASAWSPSATFQMAYLQISDWKAKWIEPGYTEDTIMRPSPLMRKQFTISKTIASATAYITAHGIYEAQINGKRVGDAYMTPGWTAYKKRLQYQVYDVTSMMKTGPNAIGIMLGNGWYRGIIGYQYNINFYGKDIALLCQVDIV